MSAGEVTVRPIRPEAAKRCEQIKTGIEAGLGNLHPTNALLICAQCTANSGGDVAVDRADALAAITARFQPHIENAGPAGAGCARCAR